MPGASRTVAGGHGGHTFLDINNSLARKLRFALVGCACFALQVTILRVLGSAGLGRTLANTVGFAVSAQANFALSRTFTWGARSGNPASYNSGQRPFGNADLQRPLFAQWATYNLTALGALGVNTIVFAIAVGTVGDIPAALVGVSAGTIVTFLVCDRLIFGSRRTAPRRRAGLARGKRSYAGRHFVGAAARHLAPPLDPHADRLGAAPIMPGST